MHKITPHQYAVGLYESITGQSESAIPGILKRFVALLDEHKQLSQADKIIAAFHQYMNEQEGIVDVTATTTTPLDQSQQQEITESLAALLEKQIVLHNVVNPSIMGGMVIKYGDTVADGSIRTKLQSLGEHLKQ